MQRLWRWFTLRPTNLLIVACGFSFFLRLGLILWRQTYLLDYAQADIGEIPYNLANGLGYTIDRQPSSYFGPGYSYLWAFFLSLFGVVQGQFYLQVLQAVLLSIIPLLLFFFTRAYFNKVIAFLTALWVAFYPELLVLSSTVYSESLMLFGWCATLALYVALIEHKKVTYWQLVVTGITIGLLILTKGRMALIAGLLIVALLINDHFVRRLPLHRYRSLWVGLVVTLIILPWSIRNYRVHQSVVLLESSIGKNLWIGHNTSALGTGKAGLGSGGLTAELEIGNDTSFPLTPILEEELQSCQTEAQCDQVYLQEAIQFMKANPVKEFSLSLNKLFYAWWFDPTSVVALHPLYRWPWIISLIFFSIGLYQNWIIQHRFYPLLWAILGVTTLVQIIFFVVPRFRYPMYPILFMYAASGLYYLLKKVIDFENLPLGWIEFSEASVGERL